MSDATPAFRPSFRSCDNVSNVCPVEATIYGSYLSPPGNAVLLAAFSACALFQIGNATYTRTKAYSYTICLLAGTICELLGYAGRLILIENPWHFSAFAMQMCCLIVGPAFIAAAVSHVAKISVHIVSTSG